MKQEITNIWCSTHKPEGLCYRVLLWEKEALSEAKLEAWRTQRAAILARMNEAGIKGSRGLLRELAAELAELSSTAIEAPLLTCAQAALSHTRVGALADALRAEAGLMAYRLTPCSALVVLELQGEESLADAIARWEAATPQLQWSSEKLIEALIPHDALELVAQIAPAAAQAQAEEDAQGSAEAQNFHHVTVLAAEAVEALLPTAGRLVVDATLGGGGHTERLLQAGAQVYGIDQDPTARAAAKMRLARFGTQFRALAGNFRNIAEMLREAGLETVDGILADIGISSPQVDCAERGFSFMADGPLDMRMNPAAPLSAADIVNNYPEAEIADILWQYGEERASRAIARRIVAQRQKAPFTRTTELADCIASVLPRKGKQNPATRSFQALRIAVNDELGALNALLEQSLGLLKEGGRLAIITFHSLEDRAVKRYFERICKPEIDRPEWPAPRPNPEYCARLVNRKPIIAGEAELAANPRSRSAKLRVIEKINPASPQR